MNVADRYYVYVYIDPRNLEEFYYGKGTGSRSHAHLQDAGDSVRVARIKAIQKEGLEPTIRIIARGLTSEEALMVETALIWKLGRTLTNVASGRYVGGFGHPIRSTRDSRVSTSRTAFTTSTLARARPASGPIASGSAFLPPAAIQKWSDPLRGLEEGDVVVAYLKGAGYVGVGVVRSSALPYATYRINGKALAEYELVEPNIGHDASDLAICEYIVAVEWMATVDRSTAVCPSWLTVAPGCGTST